MSEPVFLPAATDELHAAMIAIIAVDQVRLLTSTSLAARYARAICRLMRR